MLPTIACVSLSVALVVVGLAGSLAQRIMNGREDGDHPRVQPGPFQLLWLGQYALFALALVLSVPAALVHDLTGWTVPLRVSLPLALMLAWYLVRRLGLRTGVLFAAPRWHTLALPMLVAFAAFRALSLHSVHAGALGHDTQQHIYWTQHIADYGFLPLTARGSDLLEPYPKFFHLLAACWTAVGLSNIPGIYVKMMPFMQAALACGFLCELFLAARAASSDADRYDLVPIIAGTFLCWHLTLGDGQEVYRVRDLSGTPRYSAGWVLFALPLLTIAHRVGTFRDVRPWLVGLLPVLAAIALGINPVAVALLLSYSVPFAGLLYMATRPGAAPSGRFAWKRPLIWGSGLGAVCLLANHLVINVLARYRLPAGLLHWLGIRTTAAGLPIDIWIPRAAEGSPFCPRLGPLSCAYEVLKDTVTDAIPHYTHTISEGAPPGFGDGARSFLYWTFFAAPLLFLAARASREPARLPTQTTRIFLATLSASALTSVMLALGRSALMRLEPLGPLWSLLSAYYREQPLFLGTWLRCLLPMSSWLLVLPLAARKRWYGAAWASGSLLSIYMVSSFAPPDLVKHRYVKQQWRIDWPELRAIRHLNAFVPEHETVVITGQHWVRRNREHLLIADDPVGMIVPHLTTRLLFGIGLGSAIDYTWADLDQTLCGKSVEARQKLLRQVNARWVLARDKSAKSRAAFENVHWDCGVTLRDLAAEYPAAWSEADLALYRINP